MGGDRRRKDGGRRQWGQGNGPCGNGEEVLSIKRHRDLCVEGAEALLRRGQPVLPPPSGGVANAPSERLAPSVVLDCSGSDAVPEVGGLLLG